MERKLGGDLLTPFHRGQMCFAELKASKTCCKIDTQRWAYRHSTGGRDVYLRTHARMHARTHAHTQLLIIYLGKQCKPKRTMYVPFGIKKNRDVFFSHINIMLFAQSWDVVFKAHYCLATSTLMLCSLSLEPSQPSPPMSMCQHTTQVIRVRKYTQII